MNAFPSKSPSENPRSASQNRKLVRLIALVITFMTCGAVAQAQQSSKIVRIGLLDNTNASSITVLLEAFRRELSKLGWVEGKNLTIDYRFPSKSLSACLSLPRSLCVSRLI
jgi:hypothetical protein